MAKYPVRAHPIALSLRARDAELRHRLGGEGRWRAHRETAEIYSIVVKPAALVRAHMSTTIRKGLDGIVIDESAVSHIDGDEGRLRFRGYDIRDIAEHSDFEETLYVLWHGELPTPEEYDAFRDTLAARRQLPRPMVSQLLVTCADLGLRPMTALQTGVLGLAGRDPDVSSEYATDPERVFNIGAAIAARFPTIVAAYARIRDGKAPIAPDPELGHAENFLYMLNGETPATEAAEAMDTALQLHLDHGANASTFTARVVASTLANPYEAVASGMGALAGSLHGGANEDVIAMLAEVVETDGDMSSWLESRLASDRVIYGWGHRVYNVTDPRAEILRQYGNRLSDAAVGDATWFELASSLESTIAAETDFLERGIAPNVDFYSGPLYAQLDIPASLYTTLFAMSRVGGWIAHVEEQYADNRLIRPRLEYRGATDREWVPRDRRIQTLTSD